MRAWLGRGLEALLTLWLLATLCFVLLRAAPGGPFDAEKAAANYPLIRHYQESSTHSATPAAEGKGAWSACTPDNVGRFSAILYFFGREIHQDGGVGGVEKELHG